MSAPHGNVAIAAIDSGVPGDPGDLDLLLAAIADAIEALVAWDIHAFQLASDRQRAICDRLARYSSGRQLPATAATTRKIQELNRVYDRLLHHSIHWTRTLRSIFEAGGHSVPVRASVHFRG
jgi:hypothetical protein